MRFTPNDYVTVKLTKEGQRRALAEVDRINDALRARGCSHRASVPYDHEGIMRKQFWSCCDAVDGYDGTAGKDILFEWIEPDVKTPNI